MSGIACIYNPTDKVSPSILSKMITSLRHRGPDAKEQTIEKNGQLGLGVTYLKLSRNNNVHPSMSNEHVTLAFDGEIYNRKELRDELEKDGYIFEANTSFETVVHAYHKWGVNCLPLLNGCFAFVLYDKKQKTLLVARDQFGERPLVYTKTSEGEWLFASEVKALLGHPSIKRTVNLDQVLGDMIFGFWADQTMTFFKNINNLPAGHLILFDLKENAREPKFIKYSKLDAIEPKSYSEKDLPDIIQRYRQLLTASVQKRVADNVPFGMILSGGLDSSFIAALAAPLYYEQTGKDLTCFSVRYSRNRNVDLHFANRLSHGQKHILLKEVKVDPFTGVDEMKRLTEIMEGPVSDMKIKSILQNYAVAKRHNFSCVFNGEGSDELWFGYYRADEFYQFHESEYTTENVCYYWNEKHPFSDLFSGVTKERARAVIDENVKRNFSIYDSKDKLHNLMWFNIKTYLQSVLLLEDKLSMANSCEARSPYLDLELFKFAVSIPSELKILDDREKYIVRMAAHDYLPEGIINRKKKGFPDPSRSYYRKFLHAIELKSLKESEVISQLFSADSFDTVWEKCSIEQKYMLASLDLFEKTYV